MTAELERLCFSMRLFEGTEEEYERRHRELWPDMLEALNAAGYTNYTLFRSGLSVVGYAECRPDVATVAARMAASPVTARWNESFRKIIEPSADGELAVGFTELWHIDGEVTA